MLNALHADLAASAHAPSVHENAQPACRTRALHVAYMQWEHMNTTKPLLRRALMWRLYSPTTATTQGQTVVHPVTKILAKPVTKQRSPLAIL